MEAEIDLKEIYMIAATRIDVDYLQFLNLLELFQLQEVVIVGSPLQKPATTTTIKERIGVAIYIQCTISCRPGMIDTSWSIIGIVVLFTSLPPSMIFDGANTRGDCTQQSTSAFLNTVAADNECVKYA